MGEFVGRYICLLAIAMLSLILFFCGSKNIQAAYEEGEVSGGGTITGTVKFAGDVPEVRMLNINKDLEVCGHGPLPSEAIVVSADKAVKNAVISISGISKGKKFDRSGGNSTIDQKGCVFIPHVTIVPLGSTVDLLNSDDVMHNLHTWSIRNTAFNEGVAGGGKLAKTFKYPETIKITCDVHKWMSAWLIVQSNPYYTVTDATGNYRLEGVPAGTYTVQAWQEALGKVSHEVTVTAGGEARADFVLEKRAKKRRRRKKKKDK